ncbi:MAG TPA: hypothetical protein VMU88_08745 [bacterium]|nr:hypothetical protein [bacterium]
MQELITEQQAQQIVLGFCLLIFLGALAFAFFWKPRIVKSKRPLFMAQALLVSLTGPLLAGFWFVYNALEDHYGLDSVKALGLNALIIVVLALFWGALFFRLLPARFGRTRKA